MIRKTHLPLMAKRRPGDHRADVGVIVPSEEIVLPRTDDLVTLRSPDPTAALAAG